MDESGDLGFNFKRKKTSQYFIITFVFAKDKKILEKIVKKIFSGLTKSEARNHHGVLHAFREKPRTRQKILNLFKEKKAGDIITIYLNKKKVYTKLQDEKSVLYNYVTNILLDRVYSKKLIPTDEKVHIIASRRETNKFLNANFSSYLKNQAKNNHKVDIEIDILSPQAEKGLQIADIISWSIFRKYEHSDNTYYDLIKTEIIEENPLYR